MKRYNRENNKLLAIDIYEWCMKKEFWEDVIIYFDGKAWSSNSTWSGVNGKKIAEDLYEYEDRNPLNYFSYANPDTVSISFEGILYDILNYGSGKTEKEFEKLFEKYGLYYEYGHAWNLAAYEL